MAEPADHGNRKGEEVGRGSAQADLGTIAAARAPLLAGVDGLSQSYAVPAGGVALSFGALGYLPGSPWHGGGRR